MKRKNPEKGTITKKKLSSTSDNKGTRFGKGKKAPFPKKKEYPAGEKKSFSKPKESGKSGKSAFEKRSDIREKGTDRRDKSYTENKRDFRKKKSDEQSPFGKRKEFTSRGKAAPAKNIFSSVKKDSRQKETGKFSRPEKRKEFGKKDFERSSSGGEKKNFTGKGKSLPSRKPGKFKSKDADKSLTIPQYNLSKPAKAKKGIVSSDGSDQIRLNRYIANAGICSRRDADQLIGLGEISVNGKVVTELGYKVNRGDVVKYNSKVISPEKPVYILLNKPKDFITTTEDPQERKTVMALVQNACKERIYPVGRLDRNTTGLLLLTNDGELAKKLTHPSSNIKKLYQADLDKPLSRDDFDKILKGLELEDGPVHVDALAYVTPDKRSIGIEIHEGRNRIVRRIFEHLGYEVEKLDRVMYAGLTKKDLPRGKWKFLSEKEVIQLKFFL